MNMTIHERHEASGIEELEDIEDYRPFAIQTTSLIVLMGFTSCLIILLEVLRRYPSTRPQNHITYVIVENYPWAITTAPAVLFACLWLAVDYNVMRMEPFYQFAEAREDRTRSNDSLTFSYITCNALTIPLHALKRKQWAVFFSSLSHLITSILLPIVVTGMMAYDFDMRYDQGGPPVARIIFFPAYFWITVGLLATTVVFTGILIGTLWGRRSGVKADPSSIVGLAITFAGIDILAELRLLETQTQPNSVDLRLLHRRHIDENAGIVFRNHCRESVVQKPLLAPVACSSHIESKSNLTETAIGEDPRPSRLSRMIKIISKSAGRILLPFFLLSVAIIISCALSQEVLAEWLFAREDIIQPILILMGTLIKSFWTTIERGELEIALKLSNNNRLHKNQQTHRFPNPSYDFISTVRAPRMLS
jgi:hypothetical protein